MRHVHTCTCHSSSRLALYIVITDFITKGHSEMMTTLNSMRPQQNALLCLTYQISFLGTNNDKILQSQVRSRICIILALWRLGQEDHKFQARMSHTAGPCPKANKQQPVITLNAHEGTAPGLLECEGFPTALQQQQRRRRQQQQRRILRTPLIAAAILYG